MRVRDLFLELIAVAMGRKPDFERTPDDCQWKQLYKMACQQSLIGILSPALNDKEGNRRVPLDVYLPWMLQAEEIVKRNERISAGCRSLYETLNDDGLKSCVLKGQGTASYYPNPTLRSSGDIDVWVKGGCDQVLNYFRSRYKVGDVFYHHVDVHIFDDIPVEVHFMPSWMNSPRLDHRLQNYYRMQENDQFGNYNDSLGYCIPDTCFSSVHAIHHVFRHFFAEGVGLRQIMDCHYILCALDDKEQMKVISDLRNIGLFKFTSALMYVLKEVFGTDRKYLLCEPDPRSGALLLDDIMKSGNFGKFGSEYGKLMSASFLQRSFHKLKRLVRFIRISAEEVISAPVFKLWQKGWRREILNRPK